MDFSIWQLPPSRSRDPEESECLKQKPKSFYKPVSVASTMFKVRGLYKGMNTKTQRKLEAILEAAYHKNAKTNTKAARQFTSSEKYKF